MTVFLSAEMARRLRAAVHPDKAPPEARDYMHIVAGNVAALLAGDPIEQQTERDERMKAAKRKARAKSKLREAATSRLRGD